MIKHDCSQYRLGIRDSANYKINCTFSSLSLNPRVKDNSVGLRIECKVTESKRFQDGPIEGYNAVTFNMKNNMSGKVRLYSTHIF